MSTAPVKGEQASQSPPRSAVEIIMERTDRNQDKMKELGERTSLLEERQPLEAFRALLGEKSFSEVIRDTQKQARNLGEDLLEDQLDLDMLSGLSDSERALRKQAIAAIDGLLDRVDDVKQRLAALLERASTALESDMTASDFIQISDDARLNSEETVETDAGSEKPLKLKVDLNGDIRRNNLILQGKNPTLADVHKTVGRLYGLEPASVEGLSLKFRDASGTLEALADETMAKALSAAATTRVMRLAASRL